MFKGPPFFWYQKRASLSFKLLSPLLWIGQFFYGFFSSLKRKKSTSLKLNIPVICVGNVSLGGAGKTPTCLALYEIILETHPGASSHFITRGYKGSLKGPVLVKEDHTSLDVGDEALLLSQKAPTWVARFRQLGGKKAEKAGSTHLIMDDGLQNPSLFKDLSLIVVDGFFGFGNQHIFPMGPLRENLKESLERAQGIILIGDDIYGVQELVSRLVPSLPIIKAHFEVDQKIQKEFYKKSVIGFAGIGFPDKFYKTLQDINANILDFISFPDHYKYPTYVLRDLVLKAQKTGAVLVTTEKDYVRLPDSFQKSVSVVPITLVFDDKTKLMHLLREHLHG
ncbi:MAG: tetraacyldisaccharide 4'-kinase [Alphaproteobacteria bacterium 16-39-46]|nr:MAG: tetraacyldisaccharide 4'-kinase [Alphaproteobacteria bacterium 16-39-46]OZA42828.1 MAG: tetraacyldisaccharide 4'-kinase [Alphaproteobacteria bacterium 17-39-52]HQS84274.1 tetraacyldisaccharide 4'-kinase [Alphaproteobacteria bacterium]HQS94110.1 tetraacyldisaccharide 4'-kinase [Alphaproteobacteria bacterium]